MMKLLDLIRSNNDGYLLCTVDTPADIGKFSTLIGQLAQDTNPSMFDRIYMGRWVYLGVTFIDIIVKDDFEKIALGRQLDTMHFA